MTMLFDLRQKTPKIGIPGIAATAQASRNKPACDIPVVGPNKDQTGSFRCPRKLGGLLPPLWAVGSVKLTIRNTQGTIRLLASELALPFTIKKPPHRTEEQFGGFNP